MLPLAEIPELVGFFSYSRKDDEHSEGSLSKLRFRIYNELRMQLGREFRLWQDTAAIPHGTLWEDEIKRAIAESVFFIPIITPSAVASDHCKLEFESFLKREAELGRNDLVFPILYIRVPPLENESQWRHHDLLKVIGSRQYFDWQKLRFRDISSPEVAEKVEQFCANIFDALNRRIIAPADRTVGGAAKISHQPDDPDKGTETAAWQPKEPPPGPAPAPAPAPESVGIPRIAERHSSGAGSKSTRAAGTATTPQGSTPAIWSFKRELGVACAGIFCGVLATCGVLLPFFITSAGPMDNKLISQRMVILIPIIVIVATATFWKRYRSLLAMPAVLAYMAVTGIALCLIVWWFATYRDILGGAGTLGYLPGFLVAGLMLVTFVYVRFRAGARKGQLY
jgi:hypothetical protein